MSGRRKSTRKTPNKRKAEEVEEERESVDSDKEMVSVSRRELELLRTIQAEWEKAQVQRSFFARAFFFLNKTRLAAAGAATA